MTNPAIAVETKHLPEKHDNAAPDQSLIRLLARTSRGSMAHGTLPPDGVSRDVTHRTVEEIWYVTAGGRAKVWRKQGERAEESDVRPRTSLSIPLGTRFQFRTVGDEPFQFIMVTMPPWPGEDEAVRVPDHWPIDSDLAIHPLAVK